MRARTGTGRGTAQRRLAATLTDTTPLTPAGQSTPAAVRNPATATITGVALPAAAVTCEQCAARTTVATRPVAIKPVTAQPVAATPAQTVSPIAVAVERFLDGVGPWLAGFPANPITEQLSGALWLIRRTLFPVGDGVGQWGTAACVATKDCSGQDLTGADFRNQDLTAVRFTNANLTRAYFGGANLTRADFTGAGLLQTELSNTNLTSANLSGANLKYQDLRGVTLDGANLTNANLIGARLAGRTAAGLATATLVGANFTGQKFDSGNLAGTSLNWAGKDLTGVNLTGANMTGADLSRANLTGAEMAGVNLTRANLTDAILPGPSFASPLVTATLVGANLTNVDLSGADLSRMDLTGTVLAGANLARTKLKSTNLTGSNLLNATLTGADLTGADLTRADLLGADMLGTTLTSVVWRDTRCSYGNKTSAGCSNAALLSEPPTDWLQKASVGADTRERIGAAWQWYSYNGTGAVPDPNTENITPMLRGTQGAPLQNANFKKGYGTAAGGEGGNDGVQGVIYNDSNERVVVRTVVVQRPGQGVGTPVCCSNVILDPGDSVSYQLASGLPYWDLIFGKGQGVLEFLRYDNGQAVGDPAKLWLADQPVSRPSTEFFPPGRTEPVGRRTDWKEEEQHSEIWGSIRIDVRRERDGFRVTGSDTFKKYYRDPNDDKTNDWAIFTIRIKSL